MRLRPRQKTFVERSVAALASRGNTLGVAPTGAGKTIMLSAVTGEMIGDGAKACVLAHRDELTAQNRAKFQRLPADQRKAVEDAARDTMREQVLQAGREEKEVAEKIKGFGVEILPFTDLATVQGKVKPIVDEYEAKHELVKEFADYVRKSRK